MGLLGTMTVNFTANIAGLTAGTAAAKASLAQVASGGALVAGGLLLVGAAAVGAGAQAVKMAGDFQAGMTTLVTGAGESEKNLSMVSSGILDLAVKTGTSTKQLTDGMYMIESSGQHGAKALDTLKNAAEGARVGNASLGDVANGVTTIMTDYASKNINAAQATNTLIATVAAGKSHMSEMSAAMATILPTSSAVGVSLTDTSAAMATMTAEGTPAAAAATYLKQMLIALEAPSTKGAQALKDIGLSTQDVSNEMKVSLPGTLQLITDHLKSKFPEGSAAYVGALKDIAGGSRQMQGMLELTGDHLNVFKSNVDGIAGSVQKGGNAITGWSLVQKDFNFRMDQAKEVTETLGIKIGTALMPVVSQLTSAFGFLIGVGTNVVSFFNNNQIAMNILLPVIIAVAGAIGGILVAAVVALTIAMWPLIAAFFSFAAPFILVGVVVALVVAGIIVAIQHWGQIVSWLRGIWSAFSGWFMGLLGGIGAWFAGLWNGIIAGLKSAWSGVTGFFAGLWSGIMGGIHAAWSGVAGFFAGVWNGIVSGIRNNWNLIVNIVKIGIATVLIVLLAPIVTIAAAFIWLYNHNYYFKALVDNIINFFRNLFTWAVAAWNGFVAGLAATWQGLVSIATTLWNAITTAISVTVNSVVNAVKVAWQVAISVLTALWNGLVGIASAAWNAVSGAIRTGFNAAIGFVQWIWGQISAIFSSAWGTYISGPLTSLWTNVSSVFSSAWGTYISGPINSLWDSLSTTISGWATKAFDWGKNLIQGIIDGIKSMAAAAGDAAAGIVHNIGSFLGFHSPTEEGPGREADKWAPAFVNMYSAGLLAGMPKIQDAMNKLAAPTMDLKAGSTSYPGQSNSSAAILAAIASGSSSAASRGNTVVENHIYLDGKEITAKVGSRIANAIREKGVRNR